VASLDSGLNCRECTWSDFVARPVPTPWACDFLTVQSLTLAGFVACTSAYLIHVGTGRAFAAGITANPDAVW
jgi:hypothetical protein